MGRKERMEFQLVFLSLTCTRAGSFANILLAVLHVCTVQTVAYTLTAVRARTCKHKLMHFQGICLT